MKDAQIEYLFVLTCQHKSEDDHFAVGSPQFDRPRQKSS